MKKSLLFILLIHITFQTGFTQSNFNSPRIGIIISRTSFTHHWGVTQMSAHGWGGIANLAGIPYDCLFIEDISGELDLNKYNCLIISQCTYLSDSAYDSFLPVLEKYLSGKGSLILDGLFGKFDAAARERDQALFEKNFGIRNIGFYGGPDFRIKVKDENHFITRNFRSGEFVSQHLAGGLNIQTFYQNGSTLFELTDEKKSYPFLSVKQGPGGRVVLVNDFATWSGAASIFRNVHPQVFYKNQVYTLLIEALYWTIYGSVSEPLPSLQLSNADLTAIVRLDADASGNLNAQISTINYLINVAEETGVVPVYAWVSSTAASAGWQDLAPLGKRLERTGGQIGTHSKFHNIDQNMNEQRWKEELDDAIHEIEFNMSDYGYDIGKVNCFINPGNTIHMSDYNQIAKRFDFYMTHGFEQDMPVGFGNFTWFNENFRNFVVLENTPSPDYQWFYDPTWSYTTQQITAYQENIFDHLYNSIGRGVIFNQMWHDYSITSQPQYGKDRIVNENNIAMYDAVKEKFKNSKIYSPQPEDLRYKLCIMAQSGYSWTSKGDEINIKLDLNDVALDSAFLYTGGMGIRINNTGKKINKVFIDGKEYFAFNEDVVILPNLSGTTSELKIILSDVSPGKPHLSYISKRMPSIKKIGDDLAVDVLTMSRAKLSFNSAEGYLPINADGFRYYQINKEAECFVTSDRTINLKKLKSDKLSFLRSDLRINSISENDKIISLKVSGTSDESPGQLEFSSDQNIHSILIEDKELPVQKEQNSYLVDIQPFEGEIELKINFK